MSKYKVFLLKNLWKFKKNWMEYEKIWKYKKYKIDKTNQVKINYLIEDNNQIENYYQIEK